MGVITFQIEEDAIVPDPLAEFGGMVAQWQDIAQSRVGRLILRPAFDVAELETVSAITFSIRITDCADEPPRSRPSTPSRYTL